MIDEFYSLQKKKFAPAPLIQGSKGTFITILTKNDSSHNSNQLAYLWHLWLEKLDPRLSPKLNFLSSPLLSSFSTPSFGSLNGAVAPSPLPELSLIDHFFFLLNAKISSFSFTCAAASSFFNGAATKLASHYRQKTPPLLVFQNVTFFLGVTTNLSLVWCYQFSSFLDACFVKASSPVRLQIFPLLMVLLLFSHDQNRCLLLRKIPLFLFWLHLYSSTSMIIFLSLPFLQSTSNPVFGVANILPILVSLIYLSTKRKLHFLTPLLLVDSTNMGRQFTSPERANDVIYVCPSRSELSSWTQPSSRPHTQ